MQSEISNIVFYLQWINPILVKLHQKEIEFLLIKK